MQQSPATPRYQTQLDLSLGSWADEIEAAAKELGQQLMPWQSMGAKYVGALSPDLCSCHSPGLPLPRYKTVVVTVPRQMGKTILSRGTIKARSQREDDQSLYGTAQTRDYAAKHVLALGKALGETKARTLRGKGAESVNWPNGSTYEPIAPTESGGHGDSIDFMLVDEGWALESVVLGGVRPAMIARPHSQLLIISTMGTIESTVWNSFVSRGRESVENADAKMAYLEYSAQSDAEVQDDTLWHQWMPALGITVTKDDIHSAMEDMEPTDIIRAFGNRTTVALVSIFPDEWLKLAWRVLQPAQRFVVAVDVNDSPPGAAVTAGALAKDPNDDDAEELGLALNMMEWRYGTPVWVPKYVEKLINEGKVEAVVGDFGGPAKQIHAELKAICEPRGVSVTHRQPKEMQADTLAFYDGLREHKVFMTKSPELEAAFVGAKRRTFGDMWLVSRTQMTVDASPLISTVLAYGLARELAVQPVVDWFVL